MFAYVFWLSRVLQVFIIRIIDLLAPALQRFCCGSSHLAPRLLYFGVQRYHLPSSLVVLMLISNFVICPLLTVCVPCVVSFCGFVYHCLLLINYFTS